MIYKPEEPLIKTNPYLRDPKKRQAQFVTGVMTSTSIEGVFIAPSQLTRPPKRTAKRK